MGVVVGGLYSALSPEYPWTDGGERFNSNIIQMLSSAFAAGLLARGACWLWLRRNSK